VFDRNRSVVKQAQDHFDKVLKLWRSDAKKIPAERMPPAAYAAAGSAFYQAEVIYEDLLRIKFPEGLDFQKPSSYDSKKKAEAKKKKKAESEKRFLAYITEKGKLANKLAGAGTPEGGRGLYGTVTEFKSAHWTVAARPASAGVVELHGSALHGGDPQGPQGAGRVGQSPARDLL
jgi:hypothetical protein